MRKMNLYLFLLLFIIFFFGCVQSSEDYNDFVSPPIEYNSSGHGGGIAEDFLGHLNAGEYSKASRMLDKHSVFNSPKALKDFWRHISRNQSVYFTEPGIFFDNRDGSSVYSFPAVNCFDRIIITIEVFDNKIKKFSIDSDFAVVEETFVYLINEQFDQVSEMGTPKEVEEEWNKIIQITGKYISCNPPYYKDFIDKTATFFPVIFENGEYTIEIFHEQLLREKGMSVCILDDDK